MAKAPKNPGYTTLKSVGRSHRDEPFHLVYPILLYPKKARIDAELLNDWFAVRYLGSRKKQGNRWRIETYLNKNGRRYVNRVFFENLTDSEKVELTLRFGTEFLKEKQVRDGRLRRPRLSKEEKRQLDQMRDQFYADVARRRREAAAAQAEMEFA